MEIPVYLFTGFLESGKTTFIQEAMEGSDFNGGERTLLLLCEEGEEEYHLSKFFGTNVYVEAIDSEEELTKDLLEKLQKKHRVERIVIEYNGMWSIDTIYQRMPDQWIIYQEMTFFDGTTFLGYNQNMRQLVYDKLKSAELVVFNRCDKNFDKEQFHKIVRAANRKSQILYEYGPDDVEVDSIEDPLPYDINAPIIVVDDDAYAEWYRDINENQEIYKGKTMQIKGRCALGGGMSDDKFVFGRHVMTCCVEDIQFAGMVCKYTDAAKILTHGDWITIVATVQLEEEEMYGEVGPVLYCSNIVQAEEPNPEVAQF